MYQETPGARYRSGERKKKKESPSGARAERGRLYRVYTDARVFLVARGVRTAREWIITCWYIRLSASAAVIAATGTLLYRCDGLGSVLLNGSDEN